MRKAKGFVPIRQFAHKPKVRRNAQPIRNLQSSQRLEATSWGHIEATKHKVDLDRVNYVGTFYRPTTDLAPRLVRQPSDPTPTHTEFDNPIKWVV